MRLSPESALGSLEFMLRRAADSIQTSRDRTEDHQRLFVILAELLPSQTMHENIDVVLNNLKRGLLASNLNVQQSALNILNTLLGTKFTEQDINKITSK